jgi:hypothetical protein
MMTAEQLNIDTGLHAALIRVLKGLESGKLRHVPDTNDLDFISPSLFNMSVVAQRQSLASDHCGTVGCIGGWAYALMNGKKVDGIWIFDRERADNFVSNAPTEDLRELFYPGNYSCQSDRWEYDNITAEQAAQALRNYLTNGRPEWEEVLAGTDADNGEC